MIEFIAALVLVWGIWMPLNFYCQKKGRKALAILFKAAGTLVAVWMAAAAVFGRPGSEGVYALWILGGLVICTLADVFLEIRFELGGGLFFMGHVLYIVAFLMEFELLPASAPVFLGGFALLTWFLRRYRPKINKRLFTKLSLYAAVLSGLLAVSIPLPFAAFSKRALFGVLGTVLFVASDMALLSNRAKKRGLPQTYISLGLYYTGQLFLSLSALSIS